MKALVSRFFVAAMLLALPAGSLAALELEQCFTQDKLQALLADGVNVAKVRDNVGAFHSQRIRIAPFGYEKQPEFVSAMYRNKGMAFGRENVNQVQSMSGGDFHQLVEKMKNDFKASESKYYAFLRSTGVDPDSAFGKEITASLCVYGILTSRTIDGNEAKSRSWFWPFCLPMGR